ncbi:MAG: hypothetical protein JNM40_18425 [Myxococcales bacterium]|nr:hypothetical protein [Myxococcales bacterium]
MSLFNRWRARQAAQRDAELGINSMEQFVMGQLGPRPVLDPTNLRQAGRVAESRVSPLRRDLEDDLRAAESAYVDCTSPVITLTLLIAITVIEIWGGIRVMRAIGVVGKDQVFFGIALGIGLQSLTVFVARCARSSAREPSSSAQRLVAVVLCAIYATVVAALGYSRAQEAGDQVSTLGLLAEIAIMLTATAFPGWLSELLFEAFCQARRLKRTIERLRRDLRRDDQRLARGTAFTNRFGASSEAYDREAAEIRAIYTAEHRRASARLAPTSPTVLSSRSES